MSEFSAAEATGLVSQEKTTGLWKGGVWKAENLLMTFCLSLMVLLPIVDMALRSTTSVHLCNASTSELIGRWAAARAKAPPRSRRKCARSRPSRASSPRRNSGELLTMAKIAMRLPANGTRGTGDNRKPRPTTALRASAENSTSPRSNGSVSAG